MYLLYSSLLAISFLISIPYWAFQMLRHCKYGSGLGERLGRVASRLKVQQLGSAIWVHAVSVGEVQAVSELVSGLQWRFPQHRVVISTTTATGQKLARSRFGESNVFYFPLDFAFAIRPYLRLVHPELIVIAETEFWPNFLRLAKASGAAIAVVNARISDRSWRGYHRFEKIAELLQHLGIRFWRRSLWNGDPVYGGVFLLDTIGELASTYALADVAFVGGSLVPKGGHNIIEHAQHGVAIIVGNHTENFRDMVELFRSRDAVRVAGPAEFPLLLMDLLSNDAERQALGQRAAETLRSQMGATQRTLAALEGLLQSPRERAEMSRAGHGIV